MASTLDRIVSQRVTDALHRDGSLRKDAAAIRVSADGGTVTLEGLVSSGAARERARAAVRAVEGVLHVEDRLVIRAP